MQFTRDALEIPDPVGPTGSQIAAECRQSQGRADAVAVAHGIDHAAGCVVDRHELAWCRLVLLDVEVERLGRVLRDDDGRVQDRRTAGATRYGDVYGSWYVVDQFVQRERGFAADDCVGCSCVARQKIEVCSLGGVGPPVDTAREFNRGAFADQGRQVP